ncbi:hypothetical protein NDU88_000933 [Pleurodeles waltl]|uniref:Secreted protein n=1 Tax=Pleurodeles waltl TaxID=8319 RepID=A0AAV7URG8_PLEWA|nr:hypothetical protein NDU88_000933 [Pleurodeles waltl]
MPLCSWAPVACAQEDAAVLLGTCGLCSGGCRCALRHPVVLECLKAALNLSPGTSSAFYIARRGSTLGDAADSSEGGGAGPPGVRGGLCCVCESRGSAVTTRSQESTDPKPGQSAGTSAARLNRPRQQRAADLLCPTLQQEGRPVTHSPPRRAH